MRTFSLATALTSVGASAAFLAATVLGGPAGAAAGFTDLRPQQLSRGADIAVPHIRGTTLVAGALSVKLDAGRATLLGRSGDAFVVGTLSRNGLSNSKILRIEADGSLTTLLARVSSFDVRLSEDGRRLVDVSYVTKRSSAVRVWSARTGKRLTQKSFRNHPELLSANGHRLLLSSSARGVFWWDLRTGRTQTVTRQAGGTASIRHDLLATYTKDPYRGGCMRVTTIAAPTVTLWRSCRERVEEFSPDGARIATVDLLSDGVGPGRVWQREVDGTLLAKYSTGWFGGFGWESPTAMLLEVNGREKSATVRCTLSKCENATTPRQAQTA